MAYGLDAVARADARRHVALYRGWLRAAGNLARSEIYDYYALASAVVLSMLDDPHTRGHVDALSALRNRPRIWARRALPVRQLPAEGDTTGAARRHLGRGGHIGVQRPVIYVRCRRRPICVTESTAHLACGRGQPRLWPPTTTVRRALLGASSSSRLTTVLSMLDDPRTRGCVDALSAFRNRPRTWAGRAHLGSGIDRPPARQHLGRGHDTFVGHLRPPAVSRVNHDHTSSQVRQRPLCGFPRASRSGLAAIGPCEQAATNGAHRTRTRRLSVHDAQPKPNHTTLETHAKP